MPDDHYTPFSTLRQEVFQTHSQTYRLLPFLPLLATRHRLTQRTKKYLQNHWCPNVCVEKGGNTLQIGAFALEFDLHRLQFYFCLLVLFAVSSVLLLLLVSTLILTLRTRLGYLELAEIIGIPLTCSYLLLFPGYFVRILCPCAEGFINSILSVLQARFMTVPKTLQKRLAAISDLEQLELLTKQAATCTSLKEFEKLLQ